MTTKIYILYTFSLNFELTFNVLKKPTVSAYEFYFYWMVAIVSISHFQKEKRISKLLVLMLQIFSGFYAHTCTDVCGPWYALKYSQMWSMICLIVTSVILDML